MKETRMEKHKKLRNQITKENELSTVFVDNIDKEIDSSLKKIYFAFPKSKKIVDEKLSKKYDFENKTFLVNKKNKNIKLTKKPDLTELDKMKNKIDNYKNKFSMNDKSINKYSLNVKEKIINSFSQNYKANLKSLKNQELMMEDVSLSEIDRLREEIHNLLVKIADKSTHGENEAINQLKQEYEDKKKEFKKAVKSTEDVANTMVTDLEKLEGVEKSLNYKANFIGIKLSLIIANIIIASIVGVAIWLTIK